MTRRAEDKYGGLKLEEMVRNRNEKSLNKIIKWKIAVFFMHIGMWLFDKEKPQLMPLLADNANITMHRDEKGYLIFEKPSDFINTVNLLFETLRQEIIAEKVLIANIIPYNGDPNDLKIHQKSHGRTLRGLPFICAMRIHVARYMKPDGRTFTSDMEDVILPKRWYTKYVMLEGVGKWIRKFSLRETRNSLQKKFRINICHVTIWNHTQEIAKSSKESGIMGGLIPNTTDIFHLDEMYIKVKGVWHYLWLATESKTKIISGWALTTTRGKEGAKDLLKTIQDKIKIGIIDIWPAYKAAANELELYVRWQYCVLHAMHNVIDKRIKNGSVGVSEDVIKRIELLRANIEHLLFVSNSAKDADKSFKKIFKMRKEFENNRDISYIFEFLKENKEELFLHLKERGVHRTNNIAEFVNGVFKRRYKSIGSFQEIGAAENFIFLYLIYYNFHKFERKRISRTKEVIQNRSPMEYGGERVGSWLEYLNIGPPPPMCGWSLSNIEF
jgi:transposase-like protein